MVLNRGIDLAIDPAKIKSITKAMAHMGFEKEGRMWIREDLDIYIEAPERLRDINTDKVLKVKTDIGPAYIAGVEDMLHDRIQATKHWKSASDEEQAIRIGMANYEIIDWDYLREKCQKDDSPDKLQQIKEKMEDERSKLGRMESAEEDAKEVE